MEKQRIVVVPSIAQSKRKVIEELVTKAQKAYKNLLALSYDIGEIPEPKLCTMAWGKTVGTKEQELIRQSKALPYEEKQRLIKVWNGICLNVCRHCDTIQKLLDYVPKDNVCYDANLQIVYVSNIDEIADKMAHFDIPDGADDHWALIQSVKSAVQQLRAWEDENNVIRRPLSTLCATKEEKHFQLWALGQATTDNVPDAFKGHYEAAKKNIYY